jgi:hypothetical protein
MKCSIVPLVQRCTHQGLAFGLILLEHTMIALPNITSELLSTFPNRLSLQFVSRLPSTASPFETGFDTKHQEIRRKKPLPTAVWPSHITASFETVRLPYCHRDHKSSKRRLSSNQKLLIQRHQRLRHVSRRGFCHRRTGRGGSALELRRRHFKGPPCVLDRCDHDRYLVPAVSAD